MIFDNSFQVCEITDMDKDQHPEIIGREKLRKIKYDKSTNQYVSHYIPFIVIELNKNAGIDSAKTKLYNAKNYVFLGFDPDEEIQVVYDDLMRYKMHRPQ